MRVGRALGSFARRTFALWVLAFSAAAYLAPERFRGWTGAITPCLVVVMAGVGLTLSTEDLRLLGRRPWEALAGGILGQYGIMPLVGWGIARALRLPPDLAAGVVLVGACPGGTASNVMTLFARGDVALSVAMTTVGTLAGPILTPALVWLYAGAWVPVPAAPMLADIAAIVVLPVLGGVVASRLLGERRGLLVDWFLFASVAAIVFIIAVIVAANADRLAVMIGWVVLAVALHNALGLLLGYLFAAGLGFPEAKRRAVSIEVGMQNSGLGAKLALSHFGPVTALPSAVFSVWQNLSGAALSTWWAARG